MRLLRSQVQSNCDIALHGDVHEGLMASHTKGVKKLIAWLNEKPNRYYVHMGDAIEARPTHHKYVNVRDAKTLLPFRQAAAVRKMYAGTGDRCLAWLEGNHEYGLQRYGDIVQDLIIGDSGAPYGGGECKLRIDTMRGKQICKIYLFHPHRFSLNSNAKDEEQRLANMKARLKWFLRRKAADCLVMAIGHTHKLLTVPPVRQLLMTDNGRTIKQAYLGAGDGTLDYIEPDQRWYLNTGAFLKRSIIGADTYSALAGYDPVELGYQVVEIRNGLVAGTREVLA